VTIKNKTVVKWMACLTSYLFADTNNTRVECNVSDHSLIIPQSML